MAAAVEVTRTEAARLAGMDRQTSRDQVHRYNPRGLAGLSDRHGGTRPLLSPERSIGDVLRRFGFRRLAARPRHPGQDAAAQASFGATSPPS